MWGIYNSSRSLHIAPEPALEPSINVDTADFQSNLELLDSNVQKTGNHIL